MLTSVGGRAAPCGLDGSRSWIADQRRGANTGAYQSGSLTTWGVLVRDEPPWLYVWSRRSALQTVALRTPSRPAPYQMAELPDQPPVPHVKLFKDSPLSNQWHIPILASLSPIPIRFLF